MARRMRQNLLDTHDQRMGLMRTKAGANRTNSSTLVYKKHFGWNSDAMARE